MLTQLRFFLKALNYHLIKHFSMDNATIHKSFSASFYFFIAKSLSKTHTNIRTHPHTCACAHTHQTVAAETLSPPSISAFWIFLELLMHVLRNCTLSKGLSWARGHALLNTSTTHAHTQSRASRACSRPWPGTNTLECAQCNMYMQSSLMETFEKLHKYTHYIDILM